MSKKTYYFVVAATMDENGKMEFVLDDEVFMSRFHDGGVFDEETQSWQRPDDYNTDDALNKVLNYKLSK